MTNDNYKVQLENIFEGPMDLLVYLIRKNEINIYDIPISLITDRYLEYIEWMKSMNVDIAGDFLLMAATLIQIKSRMLLPVHEDAEDMEDPREEITRPLLEYLRLKSAAQQLKERDLLGEHIFIRPPCKASDLGKLPEREIQIDLFDLIQAFHRILENISPEISFQVITDKQSLQDRMEELAGLLNDNGLLSFRELIMTASTRSEIILTFLAILEMVKRSIAGVIQHQDTGNITLYPIENSYAGTEAYY
jgi:segregation and condensation protein A